MNPRGKMWLKLAGGLAVLFGLIMVFFGFYFMASGMTLDYVTGDNQEEQLRLMKLISLGGMYIMVNGGFHCIAGFVAILNAGSIEMAKKCKKYSRILDGLVVADVVILAIASRTMTAIGAVVVIIPLVIAVLYTIGAQLNDRQADRKEA